MTEVEGGKPESPVPSNPVVCLVPYLPLSAPLVFSGWWLGPLESFGGRGYQRNSSTALDASPKSSATLLGNR